MSEFLVALLALLFTSLFPVPANASPPVTSVKLIVCVSADKPGGVFLGTGTVIGKDQILTDEHVIHGGDLCTFDDNLVTKITYADAAEDVAVLEADTGDLSPVTISCTGFQTDHKYLGIGFPDYNMRSVPFIFSSGTFPNLKFHLVNKMEGTLVYTFLTATKHFIDFPKDDDSPVVPRLRVMLGGVRKGMSGGPILDDNGNIVGLINSYFLGNSSNRDLRDTALCPH